MRWYSLSLIRFVLLKPRLRFVVILNRGTSRYARTTVNKGSFSFPSFIVVRSLHACTEHSKAFCLHISAESRSIQFRVHQIKSLLSQCSTDSGTIVTSSLLNVQRYLEQWPRICLHTQSTQIVPACIVNRQKAASFSVEYTKSSRSTLNVSRIQEQLKAR